ncbi:hypothetical protein SpCBS45565_g02054 [Spizellomyces sp. 'palustris']|nr:hypothetical protein SpCBS45565_g02054 [Spizellomyces sp. 'palustris']
MQWGFLSHPAVSRSAAVKYHGGKSKGGQNVEDTNDDNDGRPPITPNTENGAIPGIPEPQGGSDSGLNTTILGLVGGLLAAISGIGIVCGIRMVTRRQAASRSTSPAEDPSTKPPSPISNTPLHQIPSSPKPARESVQSIALDIDDLSELVANISRPTGTRSEFSYLAATLVPAPPFPTAAYGNNKPLKTEPKNWISKSLDKSQTASHWVPNIMPQLSSLNRTLNVKSLCDSLNRPSHTATASNSLNRTTPDSPPLPKVHPITTSRPNTLNRQAPNVKPNLPTSLTLARPTPAITERRALNRTTSTKTPRTLIPTPTRSNTIPALKSTPTGSAHSLGALSEISESENFFSYISRER